MTRVIFIGADAKARHLGQKLSELGGESDVWRSYPFTAWMKLWRPSGARKGDVIVVRFLNDNPSLLLTLLKPVGDCVTLAICAVRGVRVFWLCHNIDKETECYWPFVSQLRRWLWSRRAEKIVIDDPSLMDAAYAEFTKFYDKLFPITLSPLESGPVYNRPDLEKQGREFLFRDAGGGKDPRKQLNILCAGTTGLKYYHFQLLPVLERKLREHGWNPRILVVTRFQKNGSWSRGKDYGSFIDWCERTPGVLLLREYIDLDERDWRDDVDLIWRSMADWSFPITFYNACRAEIPVLSYQAGSVGVIVERERIGATINWDFSNVGTAVETALSIPQESFKAFLGRRSWENGARELLRHSELPVVGAIARQGSGS